MTHITHIGHATLTIDIGGLRIMTDPVLRSRVGHLRRRGPALRPHSWQNVDLVLISHLHWDHLDLPSLHRLGRHVPLVVPRGARSFLARRGFETIWEVVPGSRLRFGEVEIEATFAEHEGQRPFALKDPPTPSVGYLLRHEKTIYFAGDTDLFPAMADLDPSIDLALLPVWGWGPTLGPGHMDPRRAAEALALLRPRAAMPIHWGTFHPLGMGWYNPSYLTRPPHQFAAHARQLAPATQVQIVPSGQAFAWPH